MKAVFKDIKELEQRAIDLGLDEILLMENAGYELARIIEKKIKKRKKARILFLLGGGNNAADALVAARHLKQKYFKNINLFCVNEGFKKSPLFLKQAEILKKLDFKFLFKEPDFKEFDCIVDAIFGSGFNKKLDQKTSAIIQKANLSKAFKISCDIPSALGQKLCFKADLTLCMGALKELLLEDFAKEFVGEIKLAHLGLTHKKFAPHSKTFLLEKKDLKMIERRIDSHKGSCGHIYIVASASAGTLAGLGALNFGGGLVSLLSDKSFSPLLMLKNEIHTEADAIALGMGLENLELLKDKRLLKIPLVLDANCFSSKEILRHLKRKDVVLTPHPKEFSRLLTLCFDEEISVNEIQKNRFFYAKKFAKAFQCVLLLKGANPIVIQDEEIFVVNCGNQALAKGGSGDVLSGMIAALLGAGFKALDAAKNATLAHALVAKKYKFNKNSFDALKLIKGLKCL